MPNQDITSLGPEIFSLFDKIRNQAHEYADAFETFQREGRDLIDQRRDLQRLMDRFKRELEDLQKETRANVDNAKAEVDANVERILAYTREVGKIESFIATLEKLSATYESRTAELQYVTTNIKTLVAKQVEREVREFERRFNLLVEELRGDFSVIDQKLLALGDQNRRSYTLLSDEIDGFKNKVPEAKNIVEEAMRIVSNVVDKAAAEVDMKVDRLKQELEQERKAQLEEIERNIKPIHFGSAETSGLESRLAKIAGQMGKFDTRISLLIGVAVFSSIISIIALIMSLSNVFG